MSVLGYDPRISQNFKVLGEPESVVLVLGFIPSEKFV